MLQSQRIGAGIYRPAYDQLGLDRTPVICYGGALALPWASRQRRITRVTTATGRTEADSPVVTGSRH